LCNKYIIIKGARENNLKNIDVKIPRNKLIVITGLSGSGKSSLVFDTIYAEGQRRYMESLSSYARQFLGQMDKPDVDYIEGLSPAISIDQKTTHKNPRSTVGTVTEIYDYLRLLYARIGIPHCSVCGKEINGQTVDQIVDKILTLPENSKIIILAPVVKSRKGEYIKELKKFRENGFIRARIDNNIFNLSEEIKLEKNKKHTIELIIDRLVINKNIRSRLAESIETAGNLSHGIIIINNLNENKDIIFSQNYSCPEHDISVDELTPRMFSFNSPFGACKKCTGLGVFMKIDPDLIIPDKNLSFKQGAIRPYGWSKMDPGSIAYMYFSALSKKYNFSLDEPVKNLDKNILEKILYGTGDEKLNLERKISNTEIKTLSSFEGIINNIERRYKETSSKWVKEDFESYMSEITCEKCHGKRLSPESLAVKINNINISDLCEKSVVKILKFINNLNLNLKEKLIAENILKEINSRLNFLKNVGLEYLTLSRASGTLSGGESQRIRLATQIGSCLTGVTYILDEPSIGLHQRDNNKLLKTLRDLKNLGNTVIVVEHDEDTIRAADYIIDIGPKAGIHGGELLYAGNVEDIKSCKRSITGKYLSKNIIIKIPETRRTGNGKKIKILGAKENNLKNINLEIPLGMFICVTGVSGSGKSSLINEILYKYLARELNGAKCKNGNCDEILGIENLNKIIDINQSPIGRTPRSNPATYTGVFTEIRELFSKTQEAKMKGYSSGRFSFNVKGGRCEACQGDGVIKIEMHFLPDIYVPCEICKGKRYNRETLEIKYKNKNIYDILEMTAEEALSFFNNIPKISRKLETLCEVGLNYIKLGQAATTLSGGEAQRVKLATELAKRATGKTIYILDEPTTGLHMADVHKLIHVLQKLVDSGNTVLTVEHNLDFIKTADYIIDLGPEGGDNGGLIIAQGTPEEIIKNKNSYTGKFLEKIL